MREEAFSLGADTASSFLTLGTLYLHMETTVALLKHFVAWVFDVSPAGRVQYTLTVARVCVFPATDGTQCLIMFSGHLCVFS